MYNQTLATEPGLLPAGTWREEWLAWARLFDLGAMLYLNEPAPEAIRNCEAAGQVLDECLPDERFVYFLKQAADKEVGDLRQEFFDLFFVPVSGCHCPPLGGISGQGRDVDSGRVGPFFEAVGFDPARLPGLPSYLRCLNRPDYLGFELAFMATIMEAAATRPDSAEAEALYATGRFFHQTYLTPWAARYGRQLAGTAQSDYFRACGHLTIFLSQLPLHPVQEDLSKN